MGPVLKPTKGMCLIFVMILEISMLTEIILNRERIPWTVYLPIRTQPLYYSRNVGAYHPHLDPEFPLKPNILNLYACRSV